MTENDANKTLTEVFSVPENRKSDYIRIIKRKKLIQLFIVIGFFLAFITLVICSSDELNSDGWAVLPVFILMFGALIFQYFNSTTYFISNLNSEFHLSDGQLTHYHEGIKQKSIRIDKEICLVKSMWGYFIIEGWCARSQIYGKTTITSIPLRKNVILIPWITDDFNALVDRIRKTPRSYREFLGQFKRSINHNC